MPLEDSTLSTAESSPPPTPTVPPCIRTPVLKKAYPAMIRNIERYGNPNIPLGSKEGTYCKTLRRLAFQNALSPDETTLLADLGFRFNDFEAVYEEADFDDCLDRLLRYEEGAGSNYQIPKKYGPDPELGAWVTVVRRIGRENIEEERREKLDAVGFAWKSTRKCGSSFMSAYKALRSRLESFCEPVGGGGVVGESDDIAVVWKVVDEESLGEVLRDEAVGKFLRKQKAALEGGTLSESRRTYMDRLPGFDWRVWGMEP